MAEVAVVVESWPNERVAIWPSCLAAVCLMSGVEPVSRSEMSLSSLGRVSVWMCVR